MRMKFKVWQLWREEYKDEPVFIRFEKFRTAYIAKSIRLENEGSFELFLRRLFLKRNPTEWVDFFGAKICPFSHCHALKKVVAKTRIYGNLITSQNGKGRSVTWTIPNLIKEK